MSAFEIFVTDDTRAEIAAKLAALPEGWRVSFHKPKRSLLQNAKMWAMLTDISQQVVWYGENLTPEDWKNVLTASLRKARVVPTIDGDGFVPLGLYTHVMSDEEMANLISLIQAFGDQQNVRWKAPAWFQEMADTQRTAKAK